MSFFKSIKIKPTKSKYTMFGKTSRYELLEDVTYVTTVWSKVDRITIPKGFIFDGASIPKIFWILVWSPWDTDILWAALVHDYLYSKRYKNRKYCDDVLLEWMVNSGASKHKRFLIYWAVRLFWWSHYNEL